jgi:hypothetical protein
VIVDLGISVSLFHFIDLAYPADGDYRYYYRKNNTAEKNKMGATDFGWKHKLV